MTKKSVTRSALFLNIISLLLCVSMLVGTTFAWFTDEEVSGMNTISAGNLDVELMANGVEVGPTTKLFDKVTRWEPGVVVYENLQVVNKGSLALKYQMTLNFGKENNLNGHTLSEVLKIAVIDKVEAGADRNKVLADAKNAIANSISDGRLSNFYLPGTLEAGASSDEFAVVIFWDPNDAAIDNLYNANNGQSTSDGLPLSIKFGVTLKATQKTSESDSFGSSYDRISSILPKATVNDVSADFPNVMATAGIGGAADPMPMDFALQFLPNETLEEAKNNSYKFYNADFVIKADKDVPAESIALAGFYSAWCDGLNNGNWVALTSPVDIAANEEVRLVDAMGQGNIKVSYLDICEYAIRSENSINGFLCGATDLTGVNAGTTITVELRLYKTTSDPNYGSHNGVEVSPDDYEVVGTYTYTFGSKKVATVDDLKQALTDGATEIKLTSDLTVTETLSIANGATATIDLNGNDLSYAVANNGAASAIINNKGTLNLVGEGTISFVADDPDLNAIPAYATNTITNTGTLVIGEGVTITNASAGGASYAVDNQGVFILDGGTLIGDRCALRIAKFNQPNVEFIMNSGLVSAKTPAWIHLPGSNSADAPNISVTINGGVFESTKANSADNDVLYTYSFGNSYANTSITINGGEFLGGTVSFGAGYHGDTETVAINGGTFEYDVLRWNADSTSTVLFAANK